MFACALGLIDLYEGSPPLGLFSDLRPDHWVMPYLHPQLDWGILAGYPDGTFRPNELITRAQLASIVGRAWAMLELPSDLPGQTALPYSDRADIPEWASSHVALCWHLGAPRGFSDGTFRPAAPATRADTCVSIIRLMDEAGLLYDMEGMIRAPVDRGGYLLVDTAVGETVQVNAGGAVVYRNGELASLSVLQPLDVIRACLDGSGRILWIDAFSNGVCGLVTSIDYRQREIWITPVVPPALDSGWDWSYATFTAGLPGGQISLADFQMRLLWDEYTHVFRQALPSSPLDIRAEDRVVVSLRGDSPVAAYIDAALYDAGGVCTDISGTEFVIEDMDGVSHTFRLTSSTRVTVHGALAARDSISTGARLGVVRAPGVPGEARWVEVFPSSAGSAPAGSRPGDDGDVLNSVAVATLPFPPASSLELNDLATQASRLRNEAGVEGTGTVVAVIDTGIDPAHPDLRLTPDGERKIVDWVDFTGRGSVRERARGAVGSSTAEGDVITRNVAHDTGGAMVVEGRVVTVTGPVSQCGIYRTGYFSESGLTDDSPLGRDIDRDGTDAGRYLVVAVDSELAGTYDGAYIDLDQDRVLEPAEFLRVYRRSGDVALFGSDDPVTRMAESVPFVVADIDPSGGLVNLGFDGNGHGTQAAGLVGASPSRPGDYHGLAPGVQLMALKALRSSGQGGWDSILRAAIYAAENGADIISVSVSGSSELLGQSMGSQAIHRICEEYGVLLVLAVGNSGPGLATERNPWSSQGVLTVGAYSTPEIWARDYGYDIAQAGVWYFSSLGPRSDGGLSPLVVAPGSAPAPAPYWLTASGRTLFEGTSAAVPHVAAGAALLLDASRRDGIDASGPLLRRALVEGAEPLPGCLAVEQGAGCIRLSNSWSLIKQGLTDASPLRLGDVPGLAGPSNGESQGVYLRESSMGCVTLDLLNLSVTPLTAYLVNPLGGVAPPAVTLPSEGAATIRINQNAPAEGNVASELILADVPETTGVDLRIPCTIVNPVRLAEDSGKFRDTGLLRAGSRRRHFFSVAHGCSGLDLWLVVPPTMSVDGPALRGRVSLLVYDPKGNQVYASPFIGEGTIDSTSGDPMGDLRYRVDRPEPGTWEVVVVCSPALSFYGLEESWYGITADILREDDLLLVGPPRALSFSRGTYDQVTELSLVFDGDRDMEEIVPFGCGWVPSGRDPCILPAQWLQLSGDRSVYRDLEIPPGTAALDLQVSFPVGPAMDVDLYLYRFDEQVGRLVEAGVSAHNRPGEEYVHLDYPLPGRYVAVIESHALDGEEAVVQVRGDAWPDAGHIQVNGPEIAGDGDRYVLTAHCEAPGKDGSYTGYVGIRTDKGRVLAVTRLSAVVGSPGASPSMPWWAAEDRPTRLNMRGDETRSVLINQAFYHISSRGWTCPLPDDPIEDRGCTFDIEWPVSKQAGHTRLRVELPWLSREHSSVWRAVLDVLRSPEWTNDLAQMRFHQYRGWAAGT